MEIADHPIQIDFHVCHLGEAHPLFLQSVREATDGHFHALVDVGNVREEMEAEAMSGGGGRKLTVQGLKGGEFALGTALCENERGGGKVLMARGELPDSFRGDFSQPASGLKVVLPYQRGERLLAKTVQVSLPDDLMKAVTRVLQLEPRLEALLTNLQQDISARSMSQTSRSLTDLRFERADAVKTIGGFLRKKSRLVEYFIHILYLISFFYNFFFLLTLFFSRTRAVALLEVYMEKVLVVVQTQLDALTRLLSQYQQGAAQEFDKTKGFLFLFSFYFIFYFYFILSLISFLILNFSGSVNMFSQRDQLAINAGLQSMKVRLGTSFVTHSTMDKEIQKQLAMKGATGRRMLQRECLLAKTEMGGEGGVTLLSLMIVEGYLVERRRLVGLWRALEESGGKGGEEGERVRKFLEENEGGVLKVLDEEVSFSVEEEVICHTRLTEEEEMVYRENEKAKEEEGEEREREWKGKWKDDSKPLSVVIEYKGELWAPTSTITYHISSPPLSTSLSTPLILTLRERTEIIYPRLYSSTHSTPLTSHLSAAESRLYDPLSCCSFLSLIEENNTLPAALYVLSPQQAPGVLFYASEFLNVKRGGWEMTSLDYFRLYSRLSPDKEDDEEGLLLLLFDFFFDF